MKNTIALAAILIGSSALIMTAVQGAQGPQVTRTVLMQQDLPVGNYQNTMIRVEIPAGGREGRHTHPGPLIVHVTEGAITLDYEGKPTVTYRTGETFFVEAGKIHEGINNGTVAAKGIVSAVTEKGKPLTTQVE